jgi:hypothetical protein
VPVDQGRLEHVVGEEMNMLRASGDLGWRRAAWPPRRRRVAALTALAGRIVRDHARHALDSGHIDGLMSTITAQFTGRTGGAAPSALGRPYGICRLSDTVIRRG